MQGNVEYVLQRIDERLQDLYPSTRIRIKSVIKDICNDYLTKEKDLQQCHAILHDLHARMVDVYDGAPDTTNHLPFTGGDIRDIEEVLR